MFDFNFSERQIIQKIKNILPIKVGDVFQAFCPRYNEQLDYKINSIDILLDNSEDGYADDICIRANAYDKELTWKVIDVREFSLNEVI